MIASWRGATLAGSTWGTSPSECSPRGCPQRAQWAAVGPPRKVKHSHRVQAAAIISSATRWCCARSCPQLSQYEPPPPKLSQPHARHARCAATATFVAGGVRVVVATTPVFPAGGLNPSRFAQASPGERASRNLQPARPVSYASSRPWPMDEAETSGEACTAGIQPPERPDDRNRRSTGGESNPSMNPRLAPASELFGAAIGPFLAPEGWRGT
jgi:hypothetical protein